MRATPEQIRAMENSLPDNRELHGIIKPLLDAGRFDEALSASAQFNRFREQRLREMMANEPDRALIDSFRTYASSAHSFSIYQNGASKQTVEEIIGQAKKHGLAFTTDKEHPGRLFFRKIEE